ncbi:MAG: RNA polymerase sigma factor RpoD/SigA [Planctomycetota bacterium]
MAANDAEVELYLSEISKFPLLSHDEECSLAQRIAEGDEEARHEMIRSNLRLVVSIAKHFRERGMSLLDLIEEGNLGLLKAVQRFNPAKDCKFSTYATWWIKQTVRRALISKVKPIHVPAYMFEEISRWKKAGSMLSQKLGRDVTPDEIGKHLKLPASKVAMIHKALSATGSMGRGGSSNRNGDIELDMDDVLVALPSHEEPIEIDDTEHQALHHAMDLALNERERHIIELRYGLNPFDRKNPENTLEQIGDRIGLTRERVRQVEMVALRKLQIFIERQRIQGETERQDRRRTAKASEKAKVKSKPKSAD